MHSSLRTLYKAVLTAALLASTSLAQFNDTLWHDIFGGATGPRTAAALDQHWMARASNWTVRYPGTDSAAIYGSTSTTVNTFLIYKHLLSDYEFEVTQRLPGASTNSGVQVRSTCYTTSDAPPCGAQYRVCGPQADLGKTHNGEFFAECGNALVNVNTASTPTVAPNYIYSNITACRQTHKNYPEWNTTRIRLVGAKAIGYLNDVKCYEYTITNSDWLGAGIFALQYHTGSGTNVEFKSIKLKILTEPTALAPATQARAIGYQLFEGPRQSLLLNIEEAGAYTVQIVNPDGAVQKTFQGLGPISGRSLTLGTSGMFVVKISTSGGNASKLVYVR